MFPFTVEGYQQAKAYLKKVGRYEDFMNNGTSIDGYSLVAFANSIYK